MVTQGDLDTNEKNSYSEYVDFTNNMDKESASYYYCVAMAQNVLGGEYSFRSVGNIHIPDTDAPTLQVGGSVTGSSGSGNYFRYHGTLTLTFDDNLYWLPTNGNIAEIMPVFNRASDGTTGYSLLHIWAATGRSFLPKRMEPNPRRIFQSTIRMSE